MDVVLRPTKKGSDDGHDVSCPYKALIRARAAEIASGKRSCRTAKTCTPQESTPRKKKGMAGAIPLEVVEPGFGCGVPA
jgi:hypothetical protein